MVTWISRALVLLACAIAACPSFAADKTFDQRFSASPGGRLTVEADTGSVVVVGGDARQVVVHADMSGTDDFLRDLNVSAVQDSHGVTVTGRLRHPITRWFSWFGYGWNRVRFTIDVPRDYPVDIHTSGGSIDLRHLSAAVRGRTSGGSISLQDVRGSAEAETSGGSIQGEGLNGPTAMHTSGGSIGVTDATGDLDLRTSGGSIHLRGIDGKVMAMTSGGSVSAQMRGNRGISLTTSGGSIALLLPASVHASIDAHTTGGRALSSIPMSSEISSHSSLRGAINGGGELVFLRTSGGSIHIDPLD